MIKDLLPPSAHRQRLTGNPSAFLDFSPVLDLVFFLLDFFPPSPHLVVFLIFPAGGDVLVAGMVERVPSARR
jgi:hypothetical protein